MLKSVNAGRVVNRRDKIILSINYLAKKSAAIRNKRYVNSGKLIRMQSDWVDMRHDIQHFVFTHYLLTRIRRDIMPFPNR